MGFMRAEAPAASATATRGSCACKDRLCMPAATPQGTAYRHCTPHGPLVRTSAGGWVSVQDTEASMLIATSGWHPATCGPGWLQCLHAHCTCVNARHAHQVEEASAPDGEGRVLHGGDDARRALDARHARRERHQRPVAQAPGAREAEVAAEQAGGAAAVNAAHRRDRVRWQAAHSSPKSRH